MGVYELSGAGSVKTGRTLYTSMNAGNQFGAMVPIATATNATYNNLSFTNIPQTYQDLMLVAYSNTQQAGSSADYARLLFNGGSIGMSSTVLSGDGSTAASIREGTTISGGLIGIRPAFATNLYGAQITHILNYANTTTFKTSISRSAGDANGSGTTQLIVNLWQSTAAVNSIIWGGTGNYPGPGTTVTLYGISAVSS